MIPFLFNILLYNILTLFFLVLAILVVGLGIKKKLKWIDVLLLCGALLSIMIGIRIFEYWIFMIAVVFILIFKMRN